MSSLPGPSVSNSMEPVGPGDSRLGSSGSTLRPIPPGNGDHAIFRLDLRRSVQLHRGMVLAFALAGLLLGLAYYLLTWKVYLAKSVIYVQPAPFTAPQQDGSASRWPFDNNTYETYIAQQMLNASRDNVLTAALDKLGHGKWWGTDESEQGAVERLRGKIEVTREGASEFSIGARASNPDDAARIANAVAASYIESAAGEQEAGYTLEAGALGLAVITTPAIAPLHTAKSGALPNAVAIAVLVSLFGLLAAVVRHKMDPKVYIAADVEHVLGLAPIAKLPDFDEVPIAVAEEHLLRIATAIEYACKQDELKSCIFTGAATGTGVTTVVARVRAILEAMGRTTVLVDASATPPPAHRVSSADQGEQALHTLQRTRRSSALARQMTEETEAQEGSLVLTDAAPLVVSAETEYLARHVDCAIVVIASGATTRAQLREVAATLQRLNVAAVGFVLNRIGLKKADPAFRHSVQAIEDDLSAQSESHATRTVRRQAFEYEEMVAGPKFTDNQTANKRIAAITAENAFSQPVNSPQPPPSMPAAPLAQVWEPATAFAPAVDNRAVPEKAQEADLEPTSSQVASRFDGLRNFVTVLRLRDMHKTGVPREPAAKSAPKADGLEKLSVLERAFVPAPEPVSASVASASPGLVTALPEFLLPKPVVCAPSAEELTESAASDRPDRWAGDEGERILPSLRGQYKRK